MRPARVRWRRWDESRFPTAFPGCFFLALVPYHSSLSEQALTANTVVDADVILTAAPVYQPLAALQGGERFPEGAQLLLLHAGKAEPLVSGFAASADSNISFDGSRVLFAGKQKAEDPWQIWEITLADRSLRRLIAGESDVIRPLYLPAGRLVYARKTAQGFRVEAAGVDSTSAYAPIDQAVGATVLPLSNVPGSAVPVDVLADGRILFEAGFPLGSGSTPEMYLTYSDGSGVESFRCDHGAARWGGKQLASGDVVFTHGNSLARFTSPLAHEAHVAAPSGDYAGGIAESAEGDWLVSERPGAKAHYALKKLKSPMKSNPALPAMVALLAMRDKDLVEPVVVSSRLRPKRHPSGLHNWAYANIMCLDARQSRDGDLKVAPPQVRLETLDQFGRTQSLGTAPVETDGSFFVRVPARPAHPLRTTRRKKHSGSPTAWLVLDSQGRTAHLRRLSCGSRAFIGKHHAEGPAPDDHPGGFDRLET